MILFTIELDVLKNGERIIYFPQGFTAFSAAVIWIYQNCKSASINFWLVTPTSRPFSLLINSLKRFSVLDLKKKVKMYDRTQDNS